MKLDTRIRLSIRYLHQYWAMILWIFVTTSLFYKTYKEYKLQPQYYYLRNMLGCSLCISRGTAPVITMCSFLVVLPVCRSLHTVVHRLLAKVSARHCSTWLSKVKISHMVCGLTLVIFSLIHTGAHIMNAINFSEHYTAIYPDINLAKYKGENPAILICNWTGFTGITMLIVLTLVTVTSTSKFRRTNFNSFYIIHGTVIIYLILMLSHPLSGILKEQINYKEHTPGCKMSNSSSLDNTIKVENCKSPPSFKCIQTKSWIWILIALLIYGCELFYRKYCGHSMQAIQICRMPKYGIHIRLKSQKNFRVQPGQYILIQCKEISNIEWHPFTVTKCPSPSQETMDILISVRGDWTKSLQSLIKAPFSFDEISSYISRLHHKPITFSVVGPFASCMESIRSCDVSVCIAAGVGITSYILTLTYLLENNTNTPKRLHLLWLTREPKQLMWYSKLFCDLMNKFWNNNEPDRFQIQLFVTKENNRNDIYLFKNTLIENRICIGRPVWKEEFRILSAMYKRKPISVFVCGPKTLKTELKKHCNKFNKTGYNFSYTQEGF